MLSPVVPPGMEQLSHLARSRVAADKICALVEVAVMTRQSQILRRVISPMLPGRYVLDVERNGCLMIPVQ